MREQLVDVKFYTFIYINLYYLVRVKSDSHDDLGDLYERVIDWALAARGITVLISIFQMDS